NRLAQLFRARGLRPGDHVAVFLENHVRYLEVVWAAQRAGLYWTPVNSFLAPDEVAYVLGDCGAGLLVTSAARAEVATAAAALVPGLRHRLMVDGAGNGFESYEEA